ncbi:GNAT family N-acetyltransferase [Streptomyces sp. NPDC057445]|uniref:GNAT family N-acetyltransferase n=1 Tax=Streptomyces sp. NPDC057445 TaxID=3346136 RepID=UPI0036B868A4
MSIKVVRLADVHRAELHELLLAENWTQLAKELQEDGLQVFTQYVALVEGHVAGWLEGTLRYETDMTVSGFPIPWAQVNYVLTHPSMRRKGVAGELLRRFAHDEGQAGRRFMVLWPDRRDDSSGRLAFFSAYGFQPVPGTELLGAGLRRVLTGPAGTH